MSDKDLEELDKNLMDDHDYDGIQELDNDLPRWWLILFYITVIIAIIIPVYHLFINKETDDSRYQKSWAALQDTRKKASANLAMDITKASTDSAVLEDGKKVFNTYCGTCHAPDGGGLAGPNMTDNYYIHGFNFEDSIKIINKGVPAKGMVAWESTLKPDKIFAVASYIYTLRGTRPKTPKAPQGKEYDADGNATGKVVGDPQTTANNNPQNPTNKDPENKDPETTGSDTETATGAAAAVGSSLDGKHIFNTLCAACHRPDAGGLVGPNLTDKFWVHGCKEEDLIKIINTGNIAKGMLPWKGQLTDKQITIVAKYILTLQGTNPPNPKAPEGKECD